MLRKITSLLLALLLTALCLPALSEGAQDPLCLLYDGETLVGTGAMIAGDHYVLTAGCLARDSRELTIRWAGGQAAMADLSGESYDAPVLLTMDSAVDAEPSTIAAALYPEELTYLGLLADGTRVQGYCARVAPAFSGGHAAMTLTAREGLLPGALILDAYGDLAGMIVAVYGEGKGRYLAYTNESIYFLLTGIAEHEVGQPGPQSTPASPAEDLGYVPVASALSVQAGLLTVDWRDAALDPMGGEQVTVLLQDIGDPFTFVGRCALTDGTCVFAVAPGRRYLLWTLQHQETLDLSTVQANNDYQLLELPAAEPFTQYQFADTSAWISAVPAGTEAAETEVLPAAQALTPDMLDTCDIYLQVTSTYEVTQQEEAMLTAVLETPDGAAHLVVSGFLFDPGFMACDAWHMPLNDLLTSAAEASPTGRLAPGEYVLTYYLDGEMASRVPFTVE